MTLPGVGAGPTVQLIDPASAIPRTTSGLLLCGPITLTALPSGSETAGVKLQSGSLGPKKPGRLPASPTAVGSRRPGCRLAHSARRARRRRGSRSPLGRWRGCRAVIVTCRPSGDKAAEIVPPVPPTRLADVRVELDPQPARRAVGIVGQGEHIERDAGSHVRVQRLVRRSAAVGGTLAGGWTLNVNVPDIVETTGIPDGHVDRDRSGDRRPEGERARRRLRS